MRCWDEELVAYLGGIRDRARVTLVSNAWPDTRRRIEAVDGRGVLDELVLSCEVGVRNCFPIAPYERANWLSSYYKCGVDLTK